MPTDDTTKNKDYTIPVLTGEEYAALPPHFQHLWDNVFETHRESWDRLATSPNKDFLDYLQEAEIASIEEVAGLCREVILSNAMLIREVALVYIALHKATLTGVSLMRVVRALTRAHDALQSGLTPTASDSEVIGSWKKELADIQAVMATMTPDAPETSWKSERKPFKNPRILFIGEDTIHIN